MATITIETFEHTFERAILHIGFGAGPRLVLSGPSTPEAVEFIISLAFRRAFGTVKIAGAELTARLSGWKRGGSINHGPTRGIQFAVETTLIDENMATLLEAPIHEEGKIVVYQRAAEEKTQALISRLTGDIEERSKFDDVFDNPSSEACIFARGHMSRKRFLDEATARMARDTPALAGWRVLIGNRSGRNPAVCFSVSARGQALELDVTQWSPDHTGSLQQVQGEPTPVLLHHRPQGSTYAKLSETIIDLLDNGTPAPRLLRKETNIPGAPCWISYGEQAWFAQEIQIRIASIGEEEDTIESVTLALREEPARAPCAEQDTRTIDVLVESWNEEGELLMMRPNEGAEWETGGKEHPYGEAIAVRYLTPAWFSESRGGVYLRPAAEDTRQVVLTQGETPWSPGTVLVRDDDVEEEETDILLKGATIEHSANNAKIRLEDGAIEAAAEEIGLEGEIEIAGSFNVAE